MFVFCKMKVGSFCLVVIIIFMPHSFFLFFGAVKPRLSGLVGTGLNDPDNWKYEYQWSCRSFVILPLFLGILEICCLLTPYSVDKLPPFSNGRIIIIMSVYLLWKEYWSLTFCGHDELVLKQKLACVFQTTLIELMKLHSESRSQSKSEPIRAQQNVLVMMYVTLKWVQICIMEQNKFIMHMSYFIWCEEKYLLCIIKILFNMT